MVLVSHPSLAMDDDNKRQLVRQKAGALKAGIKIRRRRKTYSHSFPMMTSLPLPLAPTPPPLLCTPPYFPPSRIQIAMHSSHPLLTLPIRATKVKEVVHLSPQCLLHWSEVHFNLFDNVDHSKRVN